jgi:single-stranded-DNA-specific exonuclease
MRRVWRPMPAMEPPVALRQAVGGHPLVATLLAQRGFADPDVALAHLDPALYRPASPWEMPGMVEAVALLGGARDRGERVRVWGDFDADGQTSTAVLVEALTTAGVRVDYDLPRRSEGHGLLVRAVEEAVRDQVDLLITCDTGIGDADVVAEGVKCGLTVIVTDHHDLPPELPPAHAVVNPKLLPEDHALRELAGVGVAYQVALALLGESASFEATGRSPLLDLLALGLVADVARQVRDVRYLIQEGLMVLRAGRRPGIQALAEAAGLEVGALDETDIGFQVGPRLNAAGRLDDARKAVRLLLTRDPDEAAAIAQELEALNRDRKARTEAALVMAEEALRGEPEALRQPVLVVEGSNWEPGVLGLVAGELVRRYGRPAIAIAHRDGEPSVGSARSVEGIDIHQAIASQAGLLLREGGHPMAAGLSLDREKVPAFRRGVLEWVQGLGPIEPEPLGVDAELPWVEAGLELARELRRMAPFGAGNPRPVLVARGGVLVRVDDVSRRRETSHRHLYLEEADAAASQGATLRVTWFNAGELPQPGERLDVAFHLGVSRWRGKERLELELVDWRPAAPAPREAVATLVTGRDVIDWRRASGIDERLTALRQRFGGGLVVWAEGLTPAPEGTATRRELKGLLGNVLALAVLTPPPSGGVLRAVLGAVRPQSVYLLPPLPPAAPSAGEFVKQVAGMLRVALRAHDGVIDVGRMAARVAAREETVMAALRGLELSGAVVLRREGGVLRAYAPGQGLLQEEPDAADALVDESAEEREARLTAAREQVRHALDHLLRETEAFRRAYATLTVEALLGAD